jgi:hypothetical protein
MLGFSSIFIQNLSDNFNVAKLHSAYLNVIPKPRQENDLSTFIEHTSSFITNLECFFHLQPQDALCSADKGLPYTLKYVSTLLENSHMYFHFMQTFHTSKGLEIYLPRTE